MQVEFHKTGERRYSVVIVRAGLPSLIKESAPGYDPFIPHDMLHFVVEQALGLHKGIFGQIASGGTAGTFEQIQSDPPNRASSRLRRKNKQRGKKMLIENLTECVESERATYTCLYDWLSSSSRPEFQIRAVEMKDTALNVIGTMTKTERAKFNKENLAKIRSEMDELSRKWSALQIKQFISLKWQPE